MKSNFFTILLALAATSLSGQNASWQQFYPNTDAYGLAARGNTILAATYFGLVQFDTLGNATYYDPVNSGLPFRQARKVAIDQAGDWWVTHPGGVAQYDGSNWTNWDTTLMGLSFWTSNATVLKTSPDGRVGVGTSTRGAAVFENNTWTSLTTTNSGLPANAVRDIAFGADGKSYFATSAGLAVLDGAVWTVYNTANTGITGFSDCKSVALTSAGIVWVTIGSNKFAKLEAGVWTEYTATGIGLTAAGFSLDLIVDAQDRIWVNYSKSISVLEAGNWTHYLESAIGCTMQLTPTNKIQPVLDGAGHYWFWSSDCDLTRFDGQIWNKMPFGGNTPELPGAVYAIAQDSAGNMWFGGDFAENEEVIARKDGDNWQTFSPIDLGVVGPSPEVFTAEGDVLGNVWFGMIGGEVLRFDGATWNVLNDVKLAYPLIGDYWTINSDSEGTVWFAGVMAGTVRSNLIRYKAGVWTYYPGDILGLPSDKFIISIAFGPNNTSWFLSNGGQLLKFDGASWETIDITNAGLPFTFARRMAVAPDGAVWLATDGGLARYDGTAWAGYTTANSDLPSDDVTRIVFDQAGGMYIGFDIVGSSASVAVLRGGVWSLIVPPGYDSGLSDEPFEMFVDRDNRLWFNGFQGSPPVFVYDPMLVFTREVFSADKQLTIFPNPGTDVLYIEVSDWENWPVQIAVRNAQGKLLYQQKKTPEDNIVMLQLPAGWPAGIYYLEAVNEKGERQTGCFVRVK